MPSTVLEPFQRVASFMRRCIFLENPFLQNQSYNYFSTWPDLCTSVALLVSSCVVLPAPAPTFLVCHRPSIFCCLTRNIDGGNASCRMCSVKEYDWKVRIISIDRGSPLCWETRTHFVRHILCRVGSCARSPMYGNFRPCGQVISS